MVDNTIRKNLSPREIRLFEGINTILCNDWPPAAKLPTDEYQRCHHEIFQLVLGDIYAETLAQYLYDIIVEKTGQRSDVAAHLSAAEAIWKLKSKIMSKV